MVKNAVFSLLAGGQQKGERHIPSKLNHITYHTILKYLESLKHSKSILRLIPSQSSCIKKKAINSKQEVFCKTRNRPFFSISDLGFIVVAITNRIWLRP